MEKALEIFDSHSTFSISFSIFGTITKLRAT